MTRHWTIWKRTPTIAALLASLVLTIATETRLAEARVYIRAASSAPAVASAPLTESSAFVVDVSAAGSSGTDALVKARLTLRRRALLIGVDKYDHLPQLQFAERDAHEVARVLTAPNSGGFASDDVDELLGSAVTRASVLQAVDRLVSDTAEDDLLVVFFSGHGIDHAGSLWFAAADTRPDQPDATAVAANEIIDRLSKAKAKRRLLIIDSCYAGAAVPSPNFDHPAAPAVAVISSSNAWGDSYEATALKHSIFSYHLLQAIEGQGDANHDGNITVAEMFAYVERNVTESEIPRRSGGTLMIQRPSQSGVDTWGDLPLTVNASTVSRVALDETPADQLQRDVVYRKAQVQLAAGGFGEPDLGYEVRKLIDAINAKPVKHRSEEEQDVIDRFLETGQATEEVMVKAATAAAAPEPAVLAGIPDDAPLFPDAEVDPADVPPGAVVVDGQAPLLSDDLALARRRALLDAYARAIDRAGQRPLSSPDAMADLSGALRTLRSKNGYVRYFRILDEGLAADRKAYRVRLSAEVVVNGDDEAGVSVEEQEVFALAPFLKMLGKPKVLVALSVFVTDADGKPVPFASAGGFVKAEEFLAQRFRELGFDARTLGDMPLAQQVDADLVRQARAQGDDVGLSSAQAALQLGRDLGFDLVVAGPVEISVRNVSPGSSNITGYQSMVQYHAKAGVAGDRFHSMQTRSGKYLSVVAKDRTDAVARALEHTAQAVADAQAWDILDVLARGHRGVSLDVQNVDYDQAMALAAAIRQLPELQQVDTTWKNDVASYRIATPYLGLSLQGIVALLREGQPGLRVAAFTPPHHAVLRSP